MIALVLGFRIAVIIAMFLVWGWLPAIAVLAALGIIGGKVIRPSSVNMEHIIYRVRIALEYGVAIFGLFATNEAFGTFWVVVLFVVWLLPSIIPIIMSGRRSCSICN